MIESQRNLDTDPGFGLEQLAGIGWTSGSTAKSYPEPALLACRSLRDVLARWLAAPGHDGEARQGPKPIVYTDNVFERLIGALQSLAVVASESMQHQLLSEIYRTCAALFPKLPADMQARMEDLALRSLSALGDHVLTSELDAALSALVESLTHAGRSGSAEQVRIAQARLAAKIGELNSRSTRATE